MRRSLVAIVLAALAAGCPPVHGTSSPSPATGPTAAASARFALPDAIKREIPPAPPGGTPVLPSSARRTEAAHAAFFAGETALANGVYYLALPNGNPFGYYSYLANTKYIYHFDMGYEYVVDATDGAGGVYFYDFASSHWWFTSRTYPFPYLYDFSLGTNLYYFPDQNNAGRYTTNPRYFYDFGTAQVTVVPQAPVNSPASLSFEATGSANNKPFSVSEPGYATNFSASASACSGIATIASGPGANTFTVTPQGAGTCNITVTDAAQHTTPLGISVTTTSLVGQ